MSDSTIPKDGIRNKRGALIIWGVPKELKAKFKTACARQGVSMRETVIAFLKDYAK